MLLIRPDRRIRSCWRPGFLGTAARAGTKVQGHVRIWRILLINRIAPLGVTARSGGRESWEQPLRMCIWRSGESSSEITTTQLASWGGRKCCATRSDPINQSNQSNPHTTLTLMPESAAVRLRRRRLSAIGSVEFRPEKGAKIQEGLLLLGNEIGRRVVARQGNALHVVAHTAIDETTKLIKRVVRAPSR